MGLPPSRSLAEHLRRQLTIDSIEKPSEGVGGGIRIGKKESEIEVRICILIRLSERRRKRNIVGLPVENAGGGTTANAAIPIATGIQRGDHDTVDVEFEVGNDGVTAGTYVSQRVVAIGRPGRCVGRLCGACLRIRLGCEHCCT